MRLYGKRFLKNSMEGISRARKESQDSIIWEIYPDLRYCMVKVSGSSALVRAWFPRNTDKIPPWLKIGMTARIAHVGGEQSRVEVIGHGLVIPSTVSGGYLPPIPLGEDSVVGGMLLSQTPSPGTAVIVYSGTYRIDGVLYSFESGTTMADGGTWFLGDGGDMSGDYLILSTDPLPYSGAYIFRYDAFVVGADGVVDYIQGTPWQYTGFYGNQDGPTPPDIPAGHILLGNYIYRWSGQPAISSADFGRSFEVPIPMQLQTTANAMINIEDPNDAYGRWGPKRIVRDSRELSGDGWWMHERIAWPVGETESDSVIVLDQYGNPATWGATGHMNQLHFQQTSGATQYLIAQGQCLNSELDARYQVWDIHGGGQEIHPPNQKKELFLDLGLGYQVNFRTWRRAEFMPEVGMWAPGYWRSDDGDDDYGAMYWVTLTHNGAETCRMAFNVANIQMVGSQLPPQYPDS